ncbi:hypothetical protein G3576_07860 [Roseomonas stagni]|uniref:HNH endonuclease n=1 Tax=Falsiroseomonas algicola TaxID=2716930 RepID=A0A6M1LIC1_9PROT|nr:hypothetical protein [Falsiroseomonas algicola]NGM19927.1 hypothetical protein [Falsiroseomonas algicola]
MENKHNPFPNNAFADFATAWGDRPPTTTATGVKVRTASGETVTMDHDGWAALRAVCDGRSPKLFFNLSGQGFGYVRYWDAERGNLGMAARVVLGDEVKPGDVVRYRDGNRLNLTRANLYLARRRAVTRHPQA